MVDALHIALPNVMRKEKALLRDMQLKEQNYVLVTLHRPSNVDEPSRLREIVRSLKRTAKETILVFPIHPRTRERLRSLGTHIKRDWGQMRLIPPQGYIETLAMLKNAECILTDSGGMQKEAFLFRTPCITLRSTTEWPETLTGKANRLIRDPSMIPAAIVHARSLNIHNKRFSNPFGDGTASQRIRKILEDEVSPSV